jgi:hypothetical protein
MHVLSLLCIGFIESLVLLLGIRLQVKQKQSKRWKKNFRTATLKFEKSKQEKSVCVILDPFQKGNNFRCTGMFLYSEHLRKREFKAYNLR